MYAGSKTAELKGSRLGQGLLQVLAFTLATLAVTTSTFNAFNETSVR